MSLSTTSFENLKDHWAVKAIGDDNLSRADELAQNRLVKSAVGEQIAFSFDSNEDDNPFMERVALAYEIAAIEGLDELSRPSGGNDVLRDQATAAAFKSFDIRRLLPVPDEIHDRLFFVLQLSSIAYCGDRWSDLQRWYRENECSLEVPSVEKTEWDKRVMYRLFDCWVRLFKKDGWKDLNCIREIIAGLRNDQQKYEEQRLNNESQSMNHAIALRLIALYHWAKATEILAQYILQGEPSDPFGQLDKHFESGIEAATASGDPQHEIILRWLQAAGRIMVTNSLWWATRTVNSRTTEFVRSLTKREHEAMFELLPPQRAALSEQGLLDQAKTAIVVDLPTSGGKTLLAQFRILQALNQFDANNGWVAYVAPTRALSAQITRRLRRDFEPINIRVEQLTAAVEVDAFEEQLLNDTEQPFHILIATPEKLSLVIRNKKVKRPMALIVMDEAHNLENDSRGLRIELLLATVKRDCPHANFLLLMPYVEKSDTIARWLAEDVNAGQSISFATTPWKPNERIIGIYSAVPDDSVRAGWHLVYETLTTTDKAMQLRGIHRVGDVKPINVPKSRIISKDKQSGFGLQTAAISTVMSKRGTSIAIANNIPTVWNMASEAAKSLPEFDTIPCRIRLVQDFLRTEVSADFQLIETLKYGVGVHHAGLSDEVRALMEWLAETGDLKVLCATSTIAQGINFPVSSIFLASRFVPTDKGSRSISPRDFWNLAGRAGRIGQDSVGVIGLAESNRRDELIEFIKENTGMLVSRLVTLLDDLAKEGKLSNLSEVIRENQWEDLRCYIAHLWAEKKNLDAVLADSERTLRQTYGYTTLRNNPESRQKAEALLSATQSYVHTIAEMRPGTAEQADSTGFSPEGVRSALTELRNLEQKLIPNDWAPDSMFGDGGRIADLFGVMLKIPQLRDQLQEIGGDGLDHIRISKITRDWVNGKSINDIAENYFSREDGENHTLALSDACRAIYRSIVNNGTWGISALSQMSGTDFDALSESDRRRINALPAMIYHGVRSEDAVLMRMNSAPRSAAEALGSIYRDIKGNDESRYSVGKARNFLKELTSQDWDRARPTDAALSGSDYKSIWKVLSGESE